MVRYHLQAHQLVGQQARTSSSASRRRWSSAPGRPGARSRPAQTRCASCAPSSRRSYTRSGRRRCSAAASPSATNWRRTRSTAARVDVQRPGDGGVADRRRPPSPWSALSRMRARVSVRAGAVPLPTRPRSSARGASERTTRYQGTPWRAQPRRARRQFQCPRTTHARSTASKSPPSTLATKQPKQKFWTRAMPPGSGW